MSKNPVLGAALHLLQYLSRAALVKARAYSRTLPVLRLALYSRSVIIITREWFIAKSMINRSMMMTIYKKLFMRQ